MLVAPDEKCRIDVCIDLPDDEASDDVGLEGDEERVDDLAIICLWLTTSMGTVTSWVTRLETPPATKLAPPAR